jgi:hypothetical protein
MNMKTSRILAFTLATLVTFVAMAKTTTAPKAHGMSVRGTISALDEKGKTLTITPAKGKAEMLVWNDATKVQNGPLAKGETASARYMKRDGHLVATVIAVQKVPAKAASTAKPAPAKTASAKPAPAAKH